MTLGSDPESRFARAVSSLEGLSVGDAFGEQMFAQDTTPREMPSKRWRWTDDTAMALSIVWCLRKFGKIRQDELSYSFADQYTRSPARGYGPAMHRLLDEYRLGQHWKDRAKALFNGSGSFGNGSVMRVPPLGAYFADDLPTVIEQAKLSAVVTHSHPEAIAGAIAAALAAAHACRSGTAIAGGSINLIDAVVHDVPQSEVRERLMKAIQLKDANPIEAAAVLGNGKDISAHDTAPFCVWIAAKYMGEFEKALWATVSVGGDVDTTSAIVGGIIGGYTGLEAIPLGWHKNREQLPQWAFAD